MALISDGTSGGRLSIALLLFQEAEVDHRLGRRLGVAGADGLLVPVPGLAGIALLIFQDAEAEHRLGRLIGVTGIDRLMQPVAAPRPFATLVKQLRDLAVRARIDSGIGMTDRASGRQPGMRLVLAHCSRCRGVGPR